MLTKKFGFISKSVVWDFYCPSGKSVRYKNWKYLSESPLFSSYVSGSGVPEYLTLSSQGRRLMGEDSVAQVSSVYLAHDEIVMRFYLHLQKLNLMERCWSEGELKMDRVLSVKGLGDGVIGKLPDLLFDLKMENSTLRFALEIERTRKSQGRYKSMNRSYQRASNVDLVLFGVADGKIEEALKREIFDGGTNSMGKEVGFFELTEFAGLQMEASLRIARKELSLKKLFFSLSKRLPQDAENLRKVSA